MARTFPFVAAGAVALAAASLAVAAPQRPAGQQPAQTRQLAETPQKQPVVLGFYEGKTVRYYNFGPIKLTCRTKQGEFLPTEMSLHAFESGGGVQILGLVQDRSEHRQRAPED